MSFSDKGRKASRSRLPITFAMEVRQGLCLCGRSSRVSRRWRRKPAAERQRPPLARQ